MTNSAISFKEWLYNLSAIYATFFANLLSTTRHLIFYIAYLPAMILISFRWSSSPVTTLSVIAQIFVAIIIGMVSADIACASLNHPKHNNLAKCTLQYIWLSLKNQQLPDWKKC